MNCIITPCRPFDAGVQAFAASNFTDAVTAFDTAAAAAPPKARRVARHNARPRRMPRLGVSGFYAASLRTPRPPPPSRPASQGLLQPRQRPLPSRRQPPASPDPSRRSPAPALDTSESAIGQAIQMYENAIATDPDDADAKANYELALLKQQQIEQMQQRQQDQKQDQERRRKKKENRSPERIRRFQGRAEGKEQPQPADQPSAAGITGRVKSPQPESSPEEASPRGSRNAARRPQAAGTVPARPPAPLPRPPRPRRKGLVEHADPARVSAMYFWNHPSRSHSGTVGTEADPPENRPPLVRRGDLRVARAVIRAIAVALPLVSALPAFATDVSFDVSPRQLNLGETATATLVFHGAQGPGSVELPPIDGLSITPGGVIQQNINGARSVRMDYRIVPTRAGSFALGPYTLDLNGETVRIPEVRLDVREASGRDGDREMIFARLRLPDSPPYVHEVFDLELRLCYSCPISNWDARSAAQRLPRNRIRARQQGSSWCTQKKWTAGSTTSAARTRVRALTAGNSPSSPPCAPASWTAASSAARNPFGGFFDDPFFRVATTPVTAAVPPQTLAVRDIPPDGRPADFSGAVGQFTFTADVRPRELKVGEPITVTLRLQGVGNIAAARPPAYADTDLFRAYEARLLGDTPDPAADRGAKTFEQVVLPRTDDLRELPPLQFSFFDPAAGQYRNVTAGPFPLTVHPSENGANAMLLQVPGGNGGGQALVLGTDLIYLKPAPSRWLDPAARAARLRLAIALHAAAPFALAALWLATRRRNRLQRDVAFARRQQAPRSARANLRKAEAALRRSPDPAAVFEPLAAAVLDYFGHRLNLPPGAVEASLILERLRSAHADPADLAQWSEFFAMADQIRYASGTSLPPDTLAGWISTVASLLRKAERSRI